MMSFWELLVAIVTGAGVLASVLGLFYTWVSKRNHKDMKDFLDQLSRENRESTERLSRENQMVLSKIDDTQRFLGELIVADGERTRQLLSREAEGVRRAISGQ